MDFATHATSTESCVDTVRILHQTIVTLRAALEKSRDEILELKSKSWPKDAVEDTLRNLSIENHILRQKAVNKGGATQEKTKQTEKEKSQSSKEKKIKQNDKTAHKLKKPKKDDNICVSTDSNLPKQLKPLEKTSANQLSKSKIICFSNTYEGDKQVSTTNSLLINALNVTRGKNSHNSNLLQQPNTDNTKEKTSVKQKKKNIQFEEEPVNDVVISRRGSISEFIVEKHDTSDISVQYAECVKKSEKLIGSPQPIRSQQGNSKPKNKLLNTNLKQKKSVCTDKIQPKSLETEKARRISKISKNNVNITPNYISEIKKENLDNVNANKEEIIEIKHEADCNTTDLNLIQNKLQIDKLETATISCDEKAKCKDTEKPDPVCTELEEKDKQNTESLFDNIDKPDLKELPREDKEFSQQNSEGTATSTTTDTTDNSTNSKDKNIEISVKIYKKSKKPIEIDIQTKKKKNSKKDKKLKMNDKSQNTSFDKEYAEPTSNQVQNTNPVSIDNASADNNIVDNILQNDVEQEVDDIELIFTTDDTKESDFKEELVPIDTYAESQLLQCPLSDYEEKLSAETSDRELEDDVFNDNFENENQENCNFQSQTYDFRRDNSQIYNSKSDNSINHEDKSLKSYYSYQDSSFENKSLEKDESFDRFEEKVRIIETDISKIGIQDVEYNMGRRNTCPNPIQYRPIIHREALGRGLNSRKCRPIVAPPNIIRKESGVQTDISALPGSAWRSESSLGHKVKMGENFTTLPSKFPHPGSRLRLSEKTVEARRVLLSDIGFTSMVPELSRSADHLCPPTTRGPVVSSYGQFLRTTDLYSPAYTSQKFVWTTTTPSDGSHSQSRYSSQYPLSSPPAPTRRCSAPVSPSKKTTVMKNTPSKVRFANGSLPELRGDWTATVDSGESTDSLVEEAEHFLRRSIDCLAPCRDVCFRSDNTKITGVRRASAPEPSRDNVPPQGWQPFLPRIPRDLHLDYWVKVISPEGRVRGGRVRYVGPLINQPEQFVGVQLSTPDGLSDGTYNNRRYFNCEPYHGLFVPFKKIIMGWRP